MKNMLNLNFLSVLFFLCVGLCLTVFLFVWVAAWCAWICFLEVGGFCSVCWCCLSWPLCDPFVVLRFLFRRLRAPSLDRLLVLRLFLFVCVCFCLLRLGCCLFCLVCFPSWCSFPPLPLLLCPVAALTVCLCFVSFFVWFACRCSFSPSAFAACALPTPWLFSFVRLLFSLFVFVWCGFSVPLLFVLLSLVGVLSPLCLCCCALSPPWPFACASSPLVFGLLSLSVFFFPLCLCCLCSADALAVFLWSSLVFFVCLCLMWLCVASFVCSLLVGVRFPLCLGCLCSADTLAVFPCSSLVSVVRLLFLGQLCLFVFVCCGLAADLLVGCCSLSWPLSCFGAQQTPTNKNLQQLLIRAKYTPSQTRAILTS